MKKKQFRPNSEYVRYRNGTWIQCRKRIYLYWYKFLIHAEQSANYTVDWSHYKLWGGKQSILGTRFDDWWEAHWEKCFGISSSNGKAQFMVSKRHKADGVRIALLCYENQHRGSNWDIAVHIQKEESRKRHPHPAFAFAVDGLKTKTRMSAGKRKIRVRDTSSRTGYSYVYEELNDAYDHNAFLNAQEKRRVQGYVSRYLKQAHGYLQSVCLGKF